MSVGQILGGFLHKPWVSPGPIIDALVASVVAPADPMIRHRARVRVTCGPIGSGKSTGIMGACLLNAMQQPKDYDGVRRYRLLILRDTYRSLWSQFIPFWQDWWWDKGKPLPGTEWSGAKDGPVDTILHLETPVGPVDVVVAMKAIGELRADDEIENFFRGFATTDIWLEEADIFPVVVYDKAITRLGRYPSRKVDGFGAVAPTLWMGSNRFLIGSWAYEKEMANEWPLGIELFIQPGGRSPGAENMHNLRIGYYDDVIARSTARTVRRLVDNKHSLPTAGLPVYEEFVDETHCRTFELDKNLRLRIGFDGGLQTLNQAAAIGQRGMAFQARFRDEVTTTHGTGVDRFADLVNEKLAEPRYAAWNGARKEIRCVVDPSAMFGHDKVAGQMNWIMAMRAKTGLNIRPARSNDPSTRREALRTCMTRLVDGQPGLLVHPDAKTLRMGLGGLFHYPKIRAGAGSRNAEGPVKNHVSHVCEGAEYFATDDEAIAAIEGKRQGARRGQRQTEAISD